MYLTIKIRRILPYLIVFCLLSFYFAILHYQRESAPVWSSKMNYKVVIDAGHGSIDSGASSGNLLEKDINLDIARILSGELKEYNIYPIMTRTEDKLYQDSRNRDIRHRVELTRESGADLFVSLHVNKYPSSQPSGSQLFYKPGCLLSKSLADHVREELLKIREVNNRVLKPGDFYVLNGAPCPAVLIEVGFISNPEDRKYLTDTLYHQQLARGIKDGIINYLQSRFGKSSDELPDLSAVHQQVSSSPNSIYYLVPGSDIVFNNRKIQLPADYQKKQLQADELLTLYALRELYNPPDGLISLLPQGTKVRSLKIVNRIAVIDFSEEIRQNFQGGGGTESYLLETISRTLFSIPGIDGFEILISGERGASIGGHIYLKQIWKNNDLIW